MNNIMLDPEDCEYLGDSLAVIEVKHPQLGKLKVCDFCYNLIRGTIS